MHVSDGGGTASAGPDLDFGALGAVYFPFLRGLAHELNNPLTGILGYSQLLTLAGVGSEAAREELGEIEGCAIRCRDLVALLSRCSKLEPEDLPYDPARLFEEVATLAGPVAHRLGVQLSVHRAEGLDFLSCRPWLLRAGLLGLVGYALEALEGAGTLDLALRRAPPGALVEIGLPRRSPEEATQAMASPEAADPTRLSSPGLGRDILERAGGSISAEQVRGRTCLLVSLR